MTIGGIRGEKRDFRGANDDLVLWFIFGNRIRRVRFLLCIPVGRGCVLTWAEIVSRRQSGGTGAYNLANGHKE